MKEEEAKALLLQLASFRGAVRAAGRDKAVARMVTRMTMTMTMMECRLPAPRRIRRELLPSASASCASSPEPPAPLVKWEPSTPTTAP